MRITDIFPDVPRATRIHAVETTETDFDLMLTFRCLQGLVNRREPHLYYVATGYERRNSSNHERFWLDYYREKFGVAIEESTDLDALLDRYRGDIDGYVVYDTERVIQTQNLAITRCGLDGTLPIAPAHEAWMTRHGIPMRDDLRGKFADDWSAAEWAVDNLWPRCYRRLFGNFCIHRAHWFSHSNHPADYIVCHRGMALDLPTSRQRRRVLDLYRRMLEEAGAPGAQMNWHCGYDQEKEYVAEAAKKGWMTLQTMFMPNLTVHGAVGDVEERHVQPRPKTEACKAEKGKIYVCFYNSDGDAASVVHSRQNNNWLAEKRGSFKFGWGFLPLSLKLMPGMLGYYHATRTPNDCLFGPSSGAAYTYSFLWPEEHVDWYISESRRLLDQSGQNGVNMVNWHLQDWWREVETDAPIRREQGAMKSGTGMICGLGGNPYAKSWLDGAIPKVHSVHIAGTGRDNVGDILRFGEECPTRPLFMFLFAQISSGIWEHLEKEMPAFNDHPEIVICSMDEFLLTLKDATDRGLVKDELYEKTPAMAERWLKVSGRHRLPIAEKVTEELAKIAHADPDERRRHLSEAGWTDLVSRELEGVAGNREKFLDYFKGRAPFFTDDEIPGALFYSAFTVAWHVIRAAITSQGVYGNHRTQCLDDFHRICAGIVDMEPFDRLFAAWDAWETGVTPPLADTIRWCDQLARETRKLRDALGPDESEAAYASWPPRTI